MRETDTHLFFWNGPYSQWYPSEFLYNDLKFSCAEQFMMYKKAMLFGDEDIAYEIMASNSPKNQKDLGQAVKGFDLLHWRRNRLPIVILGNYLKFSQNEDLMMMLIAEKRMIVEASPVDSIWGIGLHWADDRVLVESNWEGLNLLGSAIMAARKQIMLERLSTCV